MRKTVLLTVASFLGISVHAQQEGSWTIEYAVTINEHPAAYLEHVEQSQTKVMFLSDSFCLEMPLHPNHAKGTALPFEIYRQNQYSPLTVFAHSSQAVEYLPFEGLPSYTPFEESMNENFTLLDTTRTILGYKCKGYRFDGPPTPSGNRVFTIHWVCEDIRMSDQIACKVSPEAEAFWPNGFRGLPFVKLGEDRYKDGVLQVRVEAIYVSNEVEFEKYDFLLFEQQVLAYERIHYSKAQEILRSWVRHRKSVAYGKDDH